MPQEKHHYCNVKESPQRLFDQSVGLERARAINLYHKKWINGTVLTYYFFNAASDGERVLMSDGTTRFIAWKGAANEVAAVRRAFDTWAAIGLGIQFKEVQDPHEAICRIGFARGDGSWSYVGRDNYDIPKSERTMNFGWDVSTSYGFSTALHEIGHFIGLQHEHQNPNAGIVWDEAAVIRSLSGPPNNWDEGKIRRNILNKLSVADTMGTDWDPTSIMHYDFEAGLILAPAQYRNGINPPGILSAKDIAWVRSIYPPIQVVDTKVLEVAKSKIITIEAGQQADYFIEPDETRNYIISTFGVMDTLMVLFEANGTGDPIRLATDDDSGDFRNAKIAAKLVKGKRYIVSMRLYYNGAAGKTAIMYW
jgi:hypothetical protein